MSASRSLTAIKALHTVIWLFFVTCILAIPVFALADAYRYALWLTGMVLVEVLILVVNGWKCPLTGLAARHTHDRRDNFDIYLPAWLARNNKLIFGLLFVVGEAIVFLRWRGWLG